MATEAAIGRSQSPSPPRRLSVSPARRRSVSRSRSRSRSRSPDPPPSKKLDLRIPVCRDFTRGRCLMSPMDCRYAHPASTVPVEGSEVTVCYDYLLDRCTRDHGCRFFHPPPHLRAKMQEAAGIQITQGSTSYQEIAYDGCQSSHVLPPPPLLASNGRGQKEAKMPTSEVCRDFTRGRCARRAEECRYAHHMPENGNGDHVVVCQDYLHGKCQRAQCRYFHSPSHLRTHTKDRVLVSCNADQGHLQDYGPYSNAGWFYNHQSYFQALPLPLPLSLPPPPPYMSPPPRAPRADDKRPICRDFYLGGSCSRESSCRFVHPDPYLQVVDNYVTICRDFVRGHCKRDQCRFYHPLDSHTFQMRKSDADERKDIGNGSVEAVEQVDPLSPQQ